MRTTPFYLSAIIVLASVWIGSTLALPRPDVANSTASGSSVVEKSSNIKSRQFNANVPTGATGLSGGNSAGMQSPLQQLALLQQVTNSNNNPMSIASELEAQKQETLQLQNQKQQQGLLASVHIKQDQVATAQAAIANQSNMVNGHQPGAIMQAALNPQLQQLQQSLEAQKQQLLVQQQVLQQQVKPEAQQLNKQQILLAQLLNEPPAKRPQLWEQIKQTQTKQEAAMMVNPFLAQQGQSGLSPTSLTGLNVLTQPSRSQQELQRYQTLIQLLSLANLASNTNPNRQGYYSNPTRSPTSMISGSGLSSLPYSPFGSNSMNAQAVQLMQEQQMQQQMILLQRQQQMMMFQQQMAMMNPFMF